MPLPADFLSLGTLENGLTAIATILLVINYARSTAEQSQLLPVTALAVFFMGLSYLVGDNRAAAAMMFIGTVRFLCASYRRKLPTLAGKTLTLLHLPRSRYIYALALRKILFTTFLLIQLVAFGFTWKSNLDLIALAGACYSIAVIFLLKGTVFKLALIGIPLLYLGYDIAIDSPNKWIDMLTITTSLIGAIKHLLSKRKAAP